MAVIDMVMKGLEHCKNHDGTTCPECPYFHDDCVAKLCADALELLKEQQPRVLKYEELFKEETFCLWYESKEHFPMMQVACVDGEYEDNEVFVAIDDAYENWMTYGKTWRMWSSRPTDEQRKAEPWKDGEQE